MYVRRVELTDFRSYERVAVDLDPGVAVLVGQNGMGKTNLVEALGYVATLDSHRVATDAPLVRAGATSAVIRCEIVHDGRELLVELEIVPGKANRARLNRSPVRRVPRGARRAADGAVRPRGPRAGPRRPVRTPPLPRRPAGRPAAPVRRGPRRLRPGRQAAQRPAAHGVPDPQGRRHARAGPVHPRGLGPAPGPPRRRAAGRPAGAGHRAGAAPDQGVRRGRGRQGRRRHRVRVPPRRNPRRPTGPRSKRRCSRRWPSAAPPRSSAASPWSARTATTCLQRWATCPPRATRATASPGRSRWPCGWPRTTCCAPTGSSRCWCSTTSSPSSTPAAGTGWPPWCRTPTQLLVTCAVPEDVPARRCTAPATTYRAGPGDGATRDPAVDEEGRPARARLRHAIAGGPEGRPPGAGSWRRRGRSDAGRWPSRRQARPRGAAAPAAPERARAPAGGCAATPGPGPTRATRSSSARCWTGS